MTGDESRYSSDRRRAFNRARFALLSSRRRVELLVGMVGFLFFRETATL
jgi:hypothetical protein